MYIESLLKNRKIDFCIIHSNLENYDLELVYVFLKKLKELLKSLDHIEYRKNLLLKVSWQFDVYFVSNESKNLEKIKILEFDGFRFHFLVVESLKDAIENIHTSKTIRGENSDEFIETADSFLYFESIAPLLDISLSKNLILHHFFYLAEYTYSDIAICGFLPIVCNLNLAKRIIINNHNDVWNWSEFLLKNIHTFDLEIFYVEKDYRLYRMRFDLFNERSQKICRNLLSKNPNLTYNDIEFYLQNHITLLRIAPTWIEIELTNQLLLDPKIYPKDKDSTPTFLSLDLFRKIIDDLKTFEIRKSMTLCLGGIGESFHYPQLQNILELATNSNLFTKIYIETFLYELNQNVIDILKQYRDNIEIIIKLPTLSEPLYEELMGVNRIPEIKENLQKLPKDLKVYSEILRIQQVEEELDFYFSFFKKTNVEPIVGKYNDYGIMDDYKAVDLEPFDKDYCRNLMFGIYINSKGKIPLCRQDVFCRNFHYDINKNSLKQIFFDLEKYYLHFIRKEFDQISPLCKSCSEWYVFRG